MSNPFKSSSNRFNLLDDTNSTTNSRPFDKKKKQDKVSETTSREEPKENRFLKPRESNIPRNSYNERRNVKYDCVSNENIKKKEINLEENFEELFPEMVKQNLVTSESTSISLLDFKSVVNKVEIEEPSVEINITPGTVLLRYENNKIIGLRGPLTK